MYFYLEGMCKDIKKLVKECDVCQTNKYETLHPAGLLQPLPIPSWPWLDILMDFIEGLPLSNGLSVVFSIVDMLTRFTYFFPLSQPYIASKVT